MNMFIKINFISGFIQMHPGGRHGIVKSSLDFRRWGYSLRKLIKPGRKVGAWRDGGKPEIQLCWLDWRDGMVAGWQEELVFTGLWATSSCHVGSINPEVEDNPAGTGCQDLVFKVAGWQADEVQVSMTAEGGQVWMFVDQAELAYCRWEGEEAQEKRNNKLLSFSRHWHLSNQWILNHLK